MSAARVHVSRGHWFSEEARRALVVGLLGPLACGAALGSVGGGAAALKTAVYLPAVVFGVALMTLPALYIGATYLGHPAPLQRLARAGLAGLGAIGFVLLGLSPALLFMVSTSLERWVPFLLGHAVLILAAFVGLRALYNGLFDGSDVRDRMRVLFGLWALMALAFGFRFFNTAVM